jgi:hypothetical protein
MSQSVFAEVRSWSELQVALRQRAETLDVSREVLEHLTGLQSGYCAKLLAPHPIRRLGRVSLGPMLQVLGLKLLVVEDTDALERIRPRLTRRERSPRKVA